MDFLYETLKHRFPDLEDDKDYVLRNDGNGSHIAEWKTTLYPMPTLDELQTYYTTNQTSIAEMFKRPPTVEETQADLIYTLMMNGVI
jgi:XkdW protein